MHSYKYGRLVVLTLFHASVVSGPHRLPSISNALARTPVAHNPAHPAGPKETLIAFSRIRVRLWLLVVTKRGLETVSEPYSCPTAVQLPGLNPHLRH